MKSTVEALEGNKVKVIVEIEESEFDRDMDRAFKALAREVRLPGFRPGKAPRKVLEARIGVSHARQEAFREGLPNYYVDAVKEHEVDIIAPPDIEITAGEEGGPVSFDAVVEVRPAVTVSGYEGLELEIPSPTVADDEIDEQIERMLGQYGTLMDADRPAEDGDRVSIDIEVTHDGESVEGLTADDYLYQIGMGAVVPEMDEELAGCAVGDQLSFDATHPDEDEDEPLHFEITVKAIQETVLPEPDDEWAKENSEFETIVELRDDIRSNMSQTKIAQAQTARRHAAAAKLSELVADDDVPEALVAMELENQIQDMSMRLEAQGISFEQFMQFSGQSQDDFVAGLRDQAKSSAKLDLALRALGKAEDIEISEADLDEEFARAAEQLSQPPDKVRQQFSDAGQLPMVRADLQKAKALDWLIDSATIVDTDGNSIAEGDLELPEDPQPPEEAASEEAMSEEAASEEAASEEAASEEA